MIAHMVDAFLWYDDGACGWLQVNFSIVVKVDSKGAYVMDD